LAHRLAHSGASATSVLIVPSGVRTPPTSRRRAS
jgi:hypothetical protein